MIKVESMCVRISFTNKKNDHFDCSGFVKRIIKMKWITKGTLLTLISTSTACSMGGMSQIGMSESGQFGMFGDEKGIRAAMDGFSGMITNGKAPADADDTPAYQLRREQNKAEVMKFGIRFGKPIKGDE